MFEAWECDWYVLILYEEGGEGGDCEYNDLETAQSGLHNFLWELQILFHLFALNST